MPTRTDTDVSELTINTIRFLAADAVEQASSGHPGMPMGAAPMAYALWHRHLRHNPAHPDWFDRDRFILSAGHGSMLLYALLHLTGYDLPMEEIRNFRQWGSRTPGHPEYHDTPGVEVTTGPLGQGFGNGVGMAMAERFLAERYNRPGHEVIDHHTYAIVSDGDLMEGVASEAASLAGHLELGKLIYLYDDNHISIEGDTALAFTENVARRFEAYGWHIQRVEDGNDLAAIDEALTAARQETRFPSLILVRTHIGYGSPKQDTGEVHGAPLGEEALAETRRNLGWPDERFLVPEEARAHLDARERGAELESEWERRMEAYREAHPELAAELDRCIAGALPDGWDADLPRFDAGEKMATRKASGKVLNTLAQRIPNILGGSADLGPSNNTELEGERSMGPRVSGRNIHFGVREHAMGAALNGMARHGGVIPYGGTFLIFSDYMKPSVRLAALMGSHVVFVYTHDSVGLGEDGPTHQPVEQLIGLRAIPELTVIRPADANETAIAWRLAMARRGPVALALTRQGVPVLEPDRVRDAERGAYVLHDPEGTPDVVLIGTGSEVHVALAGASALAERGIAARVVSMPSWEIFEEQDLDYRTSVLPAGIARVSIEAASPFGWHRWVGGHGASIGIDRFGASAPGAEVLDRLGFNVDNVVAHALRVLGRTE